MLSFFERQIDPLKIPAAATPPEGLWRFYFHYTRQVWPALALVLVTGLAGALIEVSLLKYVGDIVDLVNASTPQALIADHGRTLLWMVFIVLVARPLVFSLHEFVKNQLVEPGFTNIVRWQAHRHVLRQSVNFFANDFAGRIASRVMQTGPALRESVLQVADAIWFVTVYAFSAFVLFAELDWRLTVPLVTWTAGYIATLFWFVPRIQQRAKTLSDARSMLNGRIVDSYTNVQTVKLFNHAEREDSYVGEALADHTAKFHGEMRYITGMNIAVVLLNGVLMAGSGALAIWLWTLGELSVGAIALTAGLAIRISNMSGYIMWVVAGVFENIGTVQEGMETISRPHTIVDSGAAVPLAVDEGAIRFDHVRFHYGRDRGMIEDLSLEIQPGEKIGLVGPSGAGKSTLVNLLLRFYDLEGGRILVDGQDISGVTQDSLRAAIGVVTQDTSLLHRSVLDNIRYGRPEVGQAMVSEAARLARADEFIPDLEDLRGRTGFDAHVGERGVKLSGGQRQRIAIARVILKDAPILILDEATSALDSEIEAAIQDSLERLMAGKTVIAIAHRLSTIAAMDRLVVMDQGRIVEAGTHTGLLEQGGLYARLWSRQSGGFLDLSGTGDQNAAE
ncbi:MAG TPA: ABC transporter ATP-binding protein [Afifellaceae bacterium]|nr:ABC transporter ATP-binding protein [Afifellaceae bacterium]